MLSTFCKTFGEIEIFIGTSDLNHLDRVYYVFCKIEMTIYDISI